MSAVGLYKCISWRRMTPWVHDYVSDPQNLAAATRGYIAGEAPDGLLTVNGAPGARRIFLMHRETLTWVASTFSADDGTYRFDDLPVNEEFDLVARDHNRVWGDVIAYAVKPKAY